MPALDFLRGLGVDYDPHSAIKAFVAHDGARRQGTAGDPAEAAIEDRRREGELIASLLGPAAPVATVPVALAGAGYEGAKAAGLTDHLPGPLRSDSTTSPASIENVIALLRGYTGAQ